MSTQYDSSVVDCLFCKIISGTIPSEKLFENEQVYAFRDIHPQAPIHILIVPKAHSESLNTLTSENRVAFLPALYEAADQIAVQLKFKENGYRTVVNNQALAGQTVYHLHLHVLSGAPLGSFGV